MKIYNSIKIVMVAATLVMTSCIGDLKVEPINPNTKTSANVYTTTQDYKQGLAKLYASLILTGQQGPSGQADIGGIDEGFSCFIRALWNVQELTTDEAVWTYAGDANGTIFNLHYQSWGPADVIPRGLFARIMNVVALSNEFIRASTNTTDPEVVRFNKEARFLRALAYYYGIDVFGNMPFVTEADEPGAFLPKQVTRAELFTYVENELKEIQNDLGEPRFEYGRANKATASMLLAKLYLNAEVYLGAGNAKYSEAITELNKVIASGYTLAPKYLNNFLADNNTSPEIIFSLNSDGARSQSYDAAWTMIKGNAGNGGWAGIRTTKALVNLFAPSDNRAFFLNEDNGQSLEIDAVNQAKEGYGIFKFRNILSNGQTPASDPTGFTDTDFPLFRLADVYLMYAEAVLRGGTGGDKATAVSYINLLRNRSGDAAIGNINENQLTLDFIIDERARELYMEAQRRSDLIRFGKFTSASYVWPWKGGVKEGKGTEAFRTLFPIPADDIAANPTLNQNEGYK